MGQGAKFVTAAPRPRTPSEQQYSDRGIEPGVGINPKMVAKWRKRQTVEDQKTDPKEPRSTVLSAQEEAVVVAVRRHTLRPLDECLYTLQPSIPHLTRSSVHRCLQRHGISRLPELDGDKPKKQRFKRYPVGFIGMIIRLSFICLPVYFVLLCVYAYLNLTS